MSAMNDLAPDDPDFALLHAYMDELHRGGAPARDALLARRPELAGLLECLDGLDRLAAPQEENGGAGTGAFLPGAPAAGVAAPPCGLQPPRSGRQHPPGGGPARRGHRRVVEGP